MFLEVKLIYNVVLVSGVQQNDSLTHTSSLFIFFSIMVYYRILKIVPSVIQQDLVAYPLYVYQSLRCVQLCDPLDCSPPGSSVQGILQARVPESVAISFSISTL